MLTQAFNWRATFWFIAAFVGACFLLFIPFKDTYRRQRSLTYQAALKRRRAIMSAKGSETSSVTQVAAISRAVTPGPENFKENGAGPFPPGTDMDADADGDLDLADLVASPPSPTLDALRITSRVAVRALLNPAPAPPPTFAFAFALGPVPESGAAPVADGDDDDEVLPQLDVPILDETEAETQVEAEAEVEVKVEVEGEGEGEPAGTNTSGTSRAEQGTTMQRRPIEATG